MGRWIDVFGTGIHTRTLPESLRHPVIYHSLIYHSVIYHSVIYHSLICHPVFRHPVICHPVICHPVIRSTAMHLPELSSSVNSAPWSCSSPCAG